MKHQVFLSFRGPDTRQGFTTHLLDALEAVKLNVFFDENTLVKGEQLSPALIQGIENSNLSIIVLSEDYASSKSCLAELYHIMCSQRQIVLPIFYKVDPSDVLNVGGSFKTSFENHESEGLGQVQQLKAAFAQVGQLKLKHWRIEEESNTPETEHIKDIVQHVIQKLLKHQVFLSFNPKDTGPNFTSHLREALRKRGINVFPDNEPPDNEPPDNEPLDRKSQAVDASNLSIVILSVDYASSESCLDELSHIMGRKETHQHIVLPIFYHVNPSDVRNIGGSFKTSFEKHKPEQVEQWKPALVEVGKLKGWHIEGVQSDRPDAEYITIVVEYAIKKLKNKSRSVSRELVGDDQKEMILKLIERNDSRIIGLWGMGGIGKTTFADAVYKAISPNFSIEDHFFFHNVSEKIEKQGIESLRNEFLSEILYEKGICVRTPSIGSSFIQERMNNKRVLVVLDDVNDSDLIDFLGVKHFGDGSKIIITSRDRQVLKNGEADHIHEVKKLNDNDALQLFSTFAFKLLNPAAELRYLSDKFVQYAQGSPLALKVLGSQLYKRSDGDWISEVNRLEKYPQSKISHILKRSFDRLDELEKNIFLDIAIFFKGKPKEEAEAVLSSCYKEAVVCGISNLVDKCLLDIIDSDHISMHDMLEEMAKDIVLQGPKSARKRSRLWSPKDVVQVLRYNKRTESIEGIKLDMSQIEIQNLQLCPTIFGNMVNLRYIHFYNDLNVENCWRNSDQPVSLPDELRYLCWDHYPFESLSSGFNPINLVVLKLHYGNMKQLWDGARQDLVNLREIDLLYCKKLEKIPSLLTAKKLEILDCRECQSLVEFPDLNHLTSLETFKIEGCHHLNKFPEVPNHFSLLDLSNTEIEEVPHSVEYIVKLERLSLRKSKVNNVSSNISKLESLCSLDLGYCPITEFPESSASLRIQCLTMDYCRSLKSLLELPKFLRCLDTHECTLLENVSFADNDLCQSDSDAADDMVSMLFSNCSRLNRDSIDNIEANAILQIQSLARRWKREGGYRKHQSSLFCCFPGNEISANIFVIGSENSSLSFKIDRDGQSGSKFLAFAICLVADLTRGTEGLAFICTYDLTDRSGKMFTSECKVSFDKDRIFTGEHVLILFSKDMIQIDNDYDEAFFEFEIEIENYSGEDEDIKVEKCGVHVFYVDGIDIGPKTLK